MLLVLTALLSDTVSMFAENFVCYIVSLILLYVPYNQPPYNCMLPCH